MTMQRLVRVGVFAAALMLAACATEAPVSTAIAPPALGLGPANAIQFTSWAFAAPSRTHGEPAVAARAVAGLDYLAGVLNTDPQWRAGSPIISAEMLRAREQVRRALGIVPTASSQEVVNDLTTVYVALANGNQAMAMQALGASIFALGPERTLALLNDLPFIPMANTATMQALQALNGVHCPLGCFRL